MSSRALHLAAAIAAALLLAGATALVGCGGDDGDAPDGAAPAEQVEPATEEPSAPYEEDATGAPWVPDEGHEGGGPDPGSEEAERSGGTSYGGGRGSGGSGKADDGLSAPERFEKFCERNPQACT